MYLHDPEDRRYEILEAVVETYISTASPVGSRALSSKLRTRLSPATIRNVMGELERLGFLMQPHTSAGRVPTALGYRYYVDHFMNRRLVVTDILIQIEELIRPESVELQPLLERTCSVLAQLSQQAAFVLAPTVKRSKVRQIQLTLLSAYRILCVLIATDEMVASHVIELGEAITQDELVAIVRFINTELIGIPFDQIIEELERRLIVEQDSIYYLIHHALTILQLALQDEPSTRLYYDGTSYILAQPEFREDPGVLQQLLQLLESQDALLQCLCADMMTGTACVRIGHEVPLDGMHACSYVIGPFTLGRQAVGGIGVLGPTRMDYARMHGLIDAMGGHLSSILSR